MSSTTIINDIFVSLQPNSKSTKDTYTFNSDSVISYTVNQSAGDDVLPIGKVARNDYEIELVLPKSASGSSSKTIPYVENIQYVAVFVLCAGDSSSAELDSPIGRYKVSSNGLNGLSKPDTDPPDGYRWTPLGLWKVNDRSYSDDYVTFTLSGHDSISSDEDTLYGTYCNAEYAEDNVTVYDALKSLNTRRDVRFIRDKSEYSFLNRDTEIPFTYNGSSDDVNYATEEELLKYIAFMGCGVARESLSGYVDICTISNQSPIKQIDPDFIISKNTNGGSFKFPYSVLSDSGYSSSESKLLYRVHKGSALEYEYSGDEYTLAVDRPNGVIPGIKVVGSNTTTNYVWYNYGSSSSSNFIAFSSIPFLWSDTEEVRSILQSINGSYAGFMSDYQRLNRYGASVKTSENLYQYEIDCVNSGDVQVGDIVNTSEIINSSTNKFVGYKALGIVTSVSHVFNKGGLTSTITCGMPKYGSCVRDAYTDYMDQVNGSSSDDNEIDSPVAALSPTETACGKWIDGRKMYRRVFSVDDAEGLPTAWFFLHSYNDPESPDELYWGTVDDDSAPAFPGYNDNWKIIDMYGSFKTGDVYGTAGIYSGTYQIPLWYGPSFYHVINVTDNGNIGIATIGISSYQDFKIVVTYVKDE